MYILIELFGEILFEGMVDATGNPKLPRWIRIIIVSLLCALPISVSTICIVEAFRNNEGIANLIVISVIEAALVGLWIFLCIKIMLSERRYKYKSKHKSEGDMDNT